MLYNNDITLLPNLQKGYTVFIAKDDTSQKKPFKISNIKNTPTKLIVAFDNITSIELAECLLGSSVFVESDTLKEVEDNTYYEAELRELSVVYANEVFGKVISCTILKSNAVLEIELNNKNKILLPFIKDIFGDINKNKKTLEINSINFLKETN